MNRLRHILLVGLLIAWAVPTQADPLADFAVVTPKVRMSAPAFSLVGLDGKQHQLSDDRGKVVILHFWATWCDSCRHEMPQLAALWKKNRSVLAVIGINVDRGNRTGVASFMEQVHANFPCLLDAAGNVRNRYHVRVLPTTYLIGRDGRITGRIIGERDWSSPAAGALLDILVYQKK